MANRRTGPARGRARQKGGSHTLPWRDDPIIVERVAIVRTLKARSYTAALMLPVVQQFMTSKGQPPISVHTVYDDLGRAAELQREETDEARRRGDDATAERIAELQEIQREAWKAFREAAGSSLNRGSYLGTIRQCSMDIARLRGLLTLKVEHSGEIATVDLEKALNDAIPDADARRKLALQVLDGGSEKVG